MGFVGHAFGRPVGASRCAARACVCAKVYFASGETRGRITVRWRRRIAVMHLSFHGARKAFRDRGRRNKPRAINSALHFRHVPEALDGQSAFQRSSAVLLNGFSQQRDSSLGPAIFEDVSDAAQSKPEPADSRECDRPGFRARVCQFKHLTKLPSRLVFRVFPFESPLIYSVLMY